MMSEPVHVTDAAFEKVVLQSKLPVVVDFWAPWCGPCRMVSPILDKLAKEQAGKMIVAKVNTDENPEYYAVCRQRANCAPASGRHARTGAAPDGHAVLEPECAADRRINLPCAAGSTT